MEKICEVLEKNCACDLKFGSAEYRKAEKTLTLIFLCEEDRYEEFSSKKDEILQNVKSYVGLDINYNIKIKKAFLDEERLELVIKNFLKKNFVSCYYSLISTKISMEENNFCVELEFSLSQNELEEIKKEILAFLQSKFFYNFNISLKSKERNCDSLDEHKNEILNSLIDPIKLNRMKFKIENNIVGEICENCCYPYQFYSSPEENIVLCGNLVNFEEIEFTKKDKETKGIRYAIKIKCLDKIFNASYFPGKKNLENIKKLEKGIDVAVQGNLDSFNSEELSLKIKSIAKCTIEPYELPKKELNKVYPTYRHISPKNYVEVVQANIFENRVEKEYLKNNDFVVFDLETTGLEPKKHKITEIGAVKIRNGQICETFSGFVNPEQEISLEITELTGITNEMVKNAPIIDDVLPDFFKFTQNAILVGQNVQFDFGFIDFAAKRLSYEFSNKIEDTLLIAKKHIFLRNYKLKTISEALNVPLINAHRAINDALATAKVFIKLIEKFY